MFKKKISDYKNSGLGICYLDESGHALSMPRTHDYIEKRKKCFGLHDLGAKGRVNAISALIGGLLFAVGLFNCSVDSIVFGTWVWEFLLPNLCKSTVILMDKASFHKNEALLALIKARGHICEVFTSILSRFKSN
ncbi:MAG TPA: transposase [Burkholderiales bacterium]|nr:transposase [Burkholderiales bacterium]